MTNWGPDLRKAYPRPVSFQANFNHNKTITKKMAMPEMTFGFGAWYEFPAKALA